MKGSQPGLDPVSILLADSDLRRLIYYEAIIQRMPDMRCIASTPQSDNVLDLVENLRPQVVLLDNLLTPIRGIDLAIDIREMTSEIAILLVGGRTLPLQEALDAGADHYLSVPVTPKSLVSAIRQVSQLARS
jgi:DNA-binding NarL/FixJ family response regulator